MGGGVIYMEDARDLAEWRSAIPFMVVDGRVIPVAAVPSESDWLGIDRPASDEIDQAMGFMGPAFGG